MTQIHLRADAGDYAPLVLLPGDPNRATRVAEMFDGGLEQSRLFDWDTTAALTLDFYRKLAALGPRR